jgi:hypothetical protein
MRISDDWIRRQIVGCLVLLLAVPFGKASTAQPQTGTAAPQSQNAAAQPAKPPVATSNSTPSADTANPQPTPQNAAEPAQNDTSKPVGTAVAPYEKTTGVPVSRPAGAVIAPAKQKRSRSFLIKVGILIGAAVAVGTVVALSSASPSRPH